MKTESFREKLNIFLDTGECRNWKRISLSDEFVDIAEYATPVKLSSRESDVLKPEKCGEEIIIPYHLNCDGSLSQSISLDESSEESTGSLLWQLPCQEFEDLWLNLVFDDNIKSELLSYMCSVMELSRRGVNSSVISVNRLIILLGVPGTGKTTLCRALSQQISLLLSPRFPRCALIEVNSHSLFSKWFSESGKLIGRLFEQVEEAAADDQCLVLVLLDEAESLCMSRSRSARGGEPVDSIRAVNAILTQLDKLRRYENVFIMCTTNLADSLDGALMDRADVVRRVSLPGIEAILRLYQTIFGELARVDMLYDVPAAEDSFFVEIRLLAEESIGLSGRSMRQVPAMGYAKSFCNRMSFNDSIGVFRDAVKEKKNSCAEGSRYV